VTIGRLWAGWRSDLVNAPAREEEEGPDGCVLCRVLASPEQDDVLRRGERVAAVLNAFPYTSGHLMVLPTRHVGELEALSPEEAGELWSVVGEAVVALKSAYRPHGVNVGANLGKAAGAGVPGHLHVHVLPRWDGDTNFMTAVAEVRVLPEALPVTGERLRAGWPDAPPASPPPAPPP
jgi:diadenosine tetraphosphate (Ap4A) HIT family hydrolase